MDKLKRGCTDPLRGILQSVVITDVIIMIMENKLPPISGSSEAGLPSNKQRFVDRFRGRRRRRRIILGLLVVAVVAYLLLR